MLCLIKSITQNCRAMKKLSLITVILIFCCVWLSAQPCLPNGIEFNTQAQIDSFQINHPNCTEIEGGVSISGNDITNLNGLSVLTFIGGELGIAENDALTSLTGLDNLTAIGGELSIGNWFAGNPLLTSLTGLDNVTTIGGGLSITNNGALTSLTGLDNLTAIGEDFLIEKNGNMISLTGLDNLTTIGGYLGIWHNHDLTSLTGLDNLTSIGGELGIVNNPVLTSLTGLDNIDATSIDMLNIYHNSSLSTCEVQSICDYLSNPSGWIDISDNAIGCNSIEEVEEACEDFSVEEQFTEDYLSLYPNPAKQEINISTDDGRNVDEVCIYTITGQQVLHTRPVNGTIDISGLQSSMYIVEVTIENTKLRQKHLVQR